MNTQRIQKTGNSIIEDDQPQPTLPHVVIVGGGFGGLTAAKKLKDQPVKVTLIDRTNYHLFQPMLYQVATSALTPADIASPLRDILPQQNTTILMAEVTAVDTQQQLVHMQDAPSLHYDYLILATGACTNYFGHPEWEKHAPGMKSLDDAMAIKNAILSALEAAEREPDEEKRKALLTIVLVGGGPTGCELAAMLGEHKRRLKRHKFQHVHIDDVRIILLEGMPRLMGAFRPYLAEQARQHLDTLGVEVHTSTLVKDITDRGVWIGDEFLASENIFWVAGVKATPIAQWLHAEADHSGRVKVQDDLSVPGLPNVFVIGDAARTTQKGRPLPALAQPALQGGRYVTSLIAARISGKHPHKPFKYIDKGSLAIVGRTFAIFESGPLYLTGTPAWLLWVFVHIYFLIGFRNRLTVLSTYAWAYFSPFQRSPGARIILREHLESHVIPEKVL